MPVQLQELVLEVRLLELVLVLVRLQEPVQELVLVLLLELEPALVSLDGLADQHQHQQVVEVPP